MATCLVTGAAGFVGSHLSTELLKRGHQVIGVDAFIPYYPRPLKKRNLAPLRAQERFAFHELDLRTADLAPLFEGVDTVFHLAAQAGLLRSWQEFESYMSCNVLATQRLLDAAKLSRPHLLHISTSSVYGRFATGDEGAPLAPISPYGITKLAAEHLVQAYATSFDLPTTILRLFSVYGPGQRPDMGYHIFIRSLLNGETITIDGDGTDSRSNTYIEDVVQGLILAFEQPDQSVGETFNIGGGEEVTVNQVLEMLQELSGIKAHTTHGPSRAGDQRRTAADITKARERLGYAPQTTLLEGLRAQLAWQRESGLAR
ncbi:MAG: NAD-dependent epimerase/dehydratase family protein [Caldilineaceae bacterium]|nr:NAD-dependent epimerase/dehydratase family protein [Caldilineaceae bacterium]